MSAAGPKESARRAGALHSVNSRVLGKHRAAGLLVELGLECVPLLQLKRTQDSGPRIHRVHAPLHVGIVFEALRAEDVAGGGRPTEQRYIGDGIFVAGQEWRCSEPIIENAVMSLDLLDVAIFGVGEVFGGVVKEVNRLPRKRRQTR